MVCIYSILIFLTICEVINLSEKTFKLLLKVKQLKLFKKLKQRKHKKDLDERAKKLQEKIQKLGEKQ